MLNWKKTKSGRFIILLALLLIGAFESSCIGFTPDGDLIGYNYRGPFQGRVIDADTREPIEGAVVFVEWSVPQMGPRPIFFDTAEVLTDSKGTFYIPKAWSWNPWTNSALEGYMLIFKVGYGHVDSGGANSSLERQSAYLKTLSPERRKQIGPSAYFDIEFEDDLPVFLIKKLTTDAERQKNMPYPGGDVPHDKKVILLQEINKERRSLGYDEVTD